VPSAFNDRHQSYRGDSEPDRDVARESRAHEPLLEDAAAAGPVRPRKVSPVRSAIEIVVAVVCHQLCTGDDPLAEHVSAQIDAAARARQRRAEPIEDEAARQGSVATEAPESTRYGPCRRPFSLVRPGEHHHGSVKTKPRQQRANRRGLRSALGRSR
jgi:hypothetical protein